MENTERPRPCVHNQGGPRVALAICTLALSVSYATVSGQSDQNLALVISQMSDLSLLQEIQATDAKLAQLGVSVQYLALTRPAPTYTLTGSTFYTGTFWRYGNMGNFTFQGQAIYQLIPNYGAQLGYAIGRATLTSRIKRPSSTVQPY
jgi:hypothetical protein